VASRAKHEKVSTDAPCAATALVLLKLAQDFTTMTSTKSSLESNQQSACSFRQRFVLMLHFLRLNFSFLRFFKARNGFPFHSPFLTRKL
jgi:hypothetical protein